MKNIEELRKIFIIDIVLFLVLLGGFFFLAPKLFKSFISLFNVSAVAVSTTPYQMFSLAVSIAFFMTMLLLSPFIFIELYMFFKDALYKNEKRIVKRLIPLIVILFVSGFIFGVSVLKISIPFLDKYSLSFGIQNLWDIQKVMEMVFITSFFLGLFFELPIVLSALIKLNVITVESLKKNRFVWWWVMYIVLMFLPPTDLISDFLMYLPVVFLYEFTLLINRGVKNVRNE